MTEHIGLWFLKRTLKHIVQRHWQHILAKQPIPKNALYLEFSQWYRMRRDETRFILGELARHFDGVSFEKHVLWVPRRYLPKREADFPGGRGGLG